MEPDRLKQIWQQSEDRGFDDAVARSAAVRRRIVRRDLLEYVVAAPVAAIFLRLCFTAPTTLARIGAAMSAASVALTVTMLYRSRAGRDHADKTMSVRQFCERELRFVDAQISLLRSVAFWYIAPMLVGTNVMVVGLNPGQRFDIGYLLLSTLLGAAVVWLNLRGVRRVFVPMREELQRIAGEQS